MTQKGASLLWLVRGPDLVTLSAALGTTCFWVRGWHLSGRELESFLCFYSSVHRNR